MAEGFKVGDLVQLKSGSSRMCIVAIRDDRYECTWRQDGKDRVGKYLAVELKPDAPMNYLTGEPDEADRDGG